MTPTPVLPAGHDRRESRPRALAPAEAALLVVTAGHLCFLPWALGSMHPWSQITSLVLAVLGLLLALLPRRDATSSPLQRGAGPAALARVLRWPVFWAGLAVLLYVFLQGINPAWRYVSDAGHWWLEPVSPLRWLPSGIDAPFVKSNPWRMLVVYAALLTLTASVWAGFTRRKSYRILLSLVAGNAAILALFGLIQRLDGTPRIFWSLWPSNGRFIASFIYPNHAGAYFNLMTALAVGLAWWSHRQSGRQSGSSAGLWLFTPVAVLTASLVVHTYSRMSSLMLVAFVLLLGVVSGLRALRRKAAPANPARRRSAVLILVLAGLLGAILTALPARQVWARFGETVNEPNTTGTDRTLARQAATDMLQERWLLGWGAGCFRHAFPLFAKNYPAIYQTPHGKIKYWEHAHNDLLEIPLELGLMGMLPVLAGLAWVVYRLIRTHFWRSPISLSLVGGCGLVTVHAWVDFVFQNPALLLTWAVLLISAIRWNELDQVAPAGGGSLQPFSRRKADTPAPAASSPA